MMNLSTITGQSGLLLLLLVGCNWKTSSSCEELNTCVGSSDAGNSGGSSNGGNSALGGNATGGISSACNPACSGTKAVCNESAKSCVECTADGNCSGTKSACNTATNTCVQCTKNGNCSGATPFCDTSKNACVACLSGTDCKDATESACVDGSCSPCTTNPDCTNISGKNVCTGGTCVQCTANDESPCGGKSCNPTKNTCTGTNRGSVDICHSCVADSECIGGVPSDAGAITMRCVPMMMGSASHGNYCLQILPASSVCLQPYTVVFSTTSASGAATAQYCGVNQSTTTCEAVLDLQASKPCSVDAECGNGQGGLCKTIVGVGLRCTIPCDISSQCPSSLTCTPPTTPYCH